QIAGRLLERNEPRCVWEYGDEPDCKRAKGAEDWRPSTIAATSAVQDFSYAERGFAEAAHCSLSESQAALQEAAFGERYQAGGISLRISCRGKHDVVASHLPFQAQPLVEPPDRGMKEEGGLDDFLREISPAVGTLNVGQFVKQDGAQLFCRELLDRPMRQQNHGTKESDCGRYSLFLGNMKSNARRFDACERFAQNGITIARGERSASDAQAAQVPEANQNPDQGKAEPERPGGENHGCPRGGDHELRGFARRKANRRLMQQGQGRNAQEGCKPNRESSARILRAAGT